MAKKKAVRAGAVPKGKLAKGGVSADLTEAERDLLSHMEQGWRLETDSLGGNPVLRSLKGDEVIRPLSANRSTVEALERRGLIIRGKGREPLTIEWRLKKEK